jgi:hypothetical protein
MTVTPRVLRGLRPTRLAGRPEVPGDPQSDSPSAQLPLKPPTGRRGTWPGSGKDARPGQTGCGGPGIAKWVCDPLSFCEVTASPGPRGAGRPGQRGFFKFEKRLLQRLAEPHPAAKARGARREHPSHTPERVGLEPSPGSPLVHSPQGRGRAQARDYFVTSLRGGERGGDEPGRCRSAGTSAAAGHLRGA